MHSLRSLTPLRTTASLLAVAFTCIVVGCADGHPVSTPPASSNNCIADASSSVKVPVLFTSDAALGQLTEFSVGVTSITLTDSCGKSVTAYTGAQRNNLDGVAVIEFAHVSGVSEPLTVASLPEASYVSANVTYTVTNAAFVYPDNHHFNASSFETNPIVVTADLANPISITSQGSALSVDLLIPQPFDLTTTTAIGGYAPVITPAFRLASFIPSSSPTNDTNGTAYVRGLTSTINSATQFSMNNSLGVPLNINSSNTTLLQGFGSLPTLPLNVPATVELNLQPDGSLLATRIQVDDASSVGTWTGPLVSTYSTGAYQYVSPQLWQQASDPTDTYNFYPFEFQFTGNTIFQQDGGTYDLTDLPFVPSFKSFADVALGQGLSISWLQEQQFGSQPQTEANTATLVPRTFSGTIAQVTTGSNFTAYTLQLSAQDTMMQLNGTSSIVAYTNAGTRMEDGSLEVGAKVNLRGLVFVNNGILQLVCDQARLQR